MTANSYPTKQMYVWLAAVLVVITAVLLFGMKFILGENNSGAAPAPAAQTQPLFGSDPGVVSAPGHKPASRSETSSGGGLDMFTKANAGIYGQEESTAPAAAPAAPAVIKSTAPAVKKPAKKETPRTVIPRMKGLKSFGGTSPTDITPHSPGQSLPDINAILKQAQEQAKPAAGN